MDTIFTDGQLMKAVRTMRQKGMTPYRFNRLLGSGIFADICDAKADLSDRAAVRAALKLEPLTLETFRIQANYEQTLEQMLTAGTYDTVSEGIAAQNFPVTRFGIVNHVATYFHFNRRLSAKSAIAEIRAAGWEPASIRCLLSLGLTSPDAQRQFPIVGLGSIAIINGTEHMPIIDEDSNGRRVYLAWFHGEVNANCRCLAVRA